MAHSAAPPPPPPRATEPSTSIHNADDGGLDEAMQHESRTSKLRRNLNAFYTRNFGLVLVFVAQTCGSIVCALSLSLSRSLGVSEVMESLCV
jgi:hypothetical protein